MPLLTLSILLALAQEPAPKVLDYTTPAVNLRKAFKEIGTQAGLKLLVSDDLAAEPIILRLKGVPVQEALDKIADVVGAEWKKREDGSFLFVRPNAMADRFEEEARNRREIGFREGIKEFVEREAKHKPLDLARARIVVTELLRLTSEQRTNRGVRNQRYELLMEAPAYRLFARIVASIDPKELSTMAPGARVVFSSHPNAMQRQYEGPWKDILEEYQTELANYIKAASEVATDGDYFLSPEVIGRPLGSEGAKIVVVIKGDLPSAMTMASVYLIEGDRARTQAGTVIDHPRKDRYAVIDDVKKAAAESRKDEEIPISEPVRQMRLRMNWQAGKQDPISGEARARLLQPEGWDPLANATSEILHGLAQQSGENLVAYVGDNFEMLALQHADGRPVRAKAFLAEARLLRDHRIESEGGWLVARCLNPNDAARIRVPRESLGVYLRTVQEEGRPTFESAGSIATTVSNDAALELARHHAWFLCSQESDLLSPEADILRLYASLSERDRADMSEQILKVPYGRLSGEQKRLVSAMWFSGNLHIDKRRAIESGPEDSPVASEPTEIAPEGIPDDGEVTFRMQIDPAVFVEDRRPSGTHEIAPSIGGLAALMVERESGPRFPGDQQGELGLAGLGSRRTFEVEIRPMPQATAWVSRMEPNSVGIRRMPLRELIASLGPNLRAEFDRQMTFTRERLANERSTPPPGSLPGGPPPP